MPVDFRYSAPPSAQLTAQNQLTEWRDCEERGRNHRPDVRNTVRTDGLEGQFQYTPCKRCPVTTRRKV